MQVCNIDLIFVIYNLLLHQAAVSNKLSFVLEKLWYCRLSPNSRFLHYGDAEGKSAPPLEALPNKRMLNSYVLLIAFSAATLLKSTEIEKLLIWSVNPISRKFLRIFIA